MLSEVFRRVVKMTWEWRMNFQSPPTVMLTLNKVNSHKYGALAEKIYALLTCIAEETQFSDLRDDEVKIHKLITISQCHGKPLVLFPGSDQLGTG